MDRRLYLEKQIKSLFNEKDIKKAEEEFEQYNRLMSYYRCAMMEIETKFNVLNEEFSLRNDRNPISSIKSRLKNPISIKEKVKRKGFSTDLAEIEKNIDDIAGVRVICSFLDDVYMLADALLKQDDINLHEMKDYIKNPKPNGYRSLHLIVSVPIFLATEKRPMKIEIQLRTIAMDCWASLEHQLRYKKEFAFTEEMSRELLECANLSSELDIKMNKLGDKILED